MLSHEPRRICLLTAICQAALGNHERDGCTTGIRRFRGYYCRLFAVQCRHWVDSGGTAQRKITSRQGRQNQHSRDRSKDQRIGCADSKQRACQKAGACERNDQPQPNIFDGAPKTSDLRPKAGVRRQGSALGGFIDAGLMVPISSFAWKRGEGDRDAGKSADQYPPEIR